MAHPKDMNTVYSPGMAIDVFDVMVRIVGSLCLDPRFRPENQRDASVRFGRENTEPDVSDFHHIVAIWTRFLNF